MTLRYIHRRHMVKSKAEIALAALIECQPLAELTVCYQYAIYYSIKKYKGCNGITLLY